MINVPVLEILPYDCLLNTERVKQNREILGHISIFCFISALSNKKS